MRITKTRSGIVAAIAALALTLMLAAGGFAFAADAERTAGTVSTTATETVTASGLVRAVKAENDSFTVSYKNDCKNKTNWGFAFSNAPDTALNIGDGSQAKDALDILINGEDFNVYQNNGWSECTSVLQDGQGAGWMLSPYSVNKPTHLTVSKSADGGVRIACYSESGNAWAKDGVDLGVSAFRNGKTLRFDDLVDENGYTYWRVAPNTDYPITVTDNRTTVSGISFENVRDISRVSIVGAKNVAGKNIYVAAAEVNENGYSFVCEDAVKIVFTDGENTVTAELGADVVFPKSNYTVTDTYKLNGNGTLLNSSDDRYSVGDSKYGMYDVTDDGVRFDIGLEIAALPTQNRNFNICIGPNTAVQAAGQNGMPEGVFSLFAYITTGGRIAVEFYDNNWQQRTATKEVADVAVGVLNHYTVEIKKTDGEWGLYFDGVKLESEYKGTEFDFDAVEGETFMSEARKTNIAVVGHNDSQATVSLLGTKIEVDASVTSVSENLYVEKAVAYDASENEVAVFDATVTDSGYSFVTLRPSDIVKTSFVTYGGVACTVDTKVAEKVYADRFEFGAGHTLTLSADTAIAVSEIEVRDESDNDITQFLTITSEDGKVVISGLADKTFDVTVAKEHMAQVHLRVEMAQANIERSVTFTAATYSVTVNLKSGDGVLENMADNIKVFAVDGDEPLAVTVEFENSKYVISGIAAGTAVRIVFEAEGYTSDSVSADGESEFVMTVSRIYTATFTVKAGDGFISDTGAVTVGGADVQVVYEDGKFVIANLTEEIRVTVKVNGYEQASHVFDADNTQAEIVLVKAASLDKSALQASVNAAKTALAEANVSADGSDVPTDSKWVTSTDKTTLEEAVAAAEGILNSATVQSQIDEAKATLDTAVQAFRTVMKNGTQSADANGDSDGKGGCGGNADATLTVAALALILAAGVIVRKKANSAKK